MKIFDLIFLIHGWNKGTPRDKDYRSYNHGTLTCLVRLHVESTWWVNSYLILIKILEGQRFFWNLKLFIKTSICH